ANFLLKKFGLKVEVLEQTTAGRIWRHTLEHLDLVRKSLIAAIFVAIPLGILAAKQPAAGQVVLAVVGIIQTIPALALLVMLMKPAHYLGLSSIGSGSAPAVMALFLYSLLPIVRNTYSGLHDIPVSLQESAAALGLPPLARLARIELPIASRTILAGIKTAAVINVGFATLGAMIGAGGYGQPILTGIRLNDNNLILQGAIPAAVMALLVQGIFDLAERGIVSQGLRLKTEQ
ncbi:MAG: ABC transporter permease, partial [Planctomycetes bacterium]|nr:ABC transporter permease [Planctomycetota bacterium]